MKISIRPAHIEDARNTVQAHFNSVHGTGAQFYPKAICEEWSPPLTDKRVKEFEDAIVSTTEVVFVAEVDGQIAGFASIVPKNGELRAVYVDPRYGRQGIGKQLLDKVEAEARARGIRKLVMDASLSAEAFYKSQGYVEISCIEHTLSSGGKTRAVKMAKVLR
jgi:putative acetyltransferase